MNPTSSTALPGSSLHAERRRRELDRLADGDVVDVLVVGLGADQVGGGALHEDAAFDGALVGDVELPGREVAQPAVDQLGAPAGGAEREVVGVDRGDPEPAGGGVYTEPPGF